MRFSHVLVRRVDLFFDLLLQCVNFFFHVGIHSVANAGHGFFKNLPHRPGQQVRASIQGDLYTCATLYFIKRCDEYHSWFFVFHSNNLNLFTIR